MECNKEEARKAIEMAERKLSENDFSGAKKFINKAHNLYPNLDGLKQGLMMVDVYISASNRGEEEEADWYGILGVDPLADDESVKKQYRKLALLLHPDKNKLNGAEGAFKLVTEAWCMLSDKVTRTSYDQRGSLKKQRPRCRNNHTHISRLLVGCKNHQTHVSLLLIMAITMLETEMQRLRCINNHTHIGLLLVGCRNHQTHVTLLQIVVMKMLETVLWIKVLGI
ncbi:PREDICTED: dnaJ homolog subfamily B member 12-like [Camelina sativa]|uniref:DnaJ homolog subfamily B member 12-like n=1 Tax=Camelina sativa TaxID=90675 RepID=A0ABM1QK56_CAMSA|nr:PREDICTED: dnaJ homolog subfamily B member 12-like [Camelina sativa]